MEEALKSGRKQQDGDLTKEGRELMGRWVLLFLRRPLDGSDGLGVPVELGDGLALAKGSQVPDPERAVVSAAHNKVIHQPGHPRNTHAAQASRVREALCRRDAEKARSARMRRGRVKSRENEAGRAQLRRARTEYRACSLHRHLSKPLPLLLALECARICSKSFAIGAKRRMRKGAGGHVATETHLFHEATLTSAPCPSSTVMAEPLFLRRSHTRRVLRAHGTARVDARAHARS
eukprot:6183669-Pleurochrysis_carterae.AAC.4